MSLSQWWGSQMIWQSKETTQWFRFFLLCRRLRRHRHRHHHHHHHHATFSTKISKRALFIFVYFRIRYQFRYCRKNKLTHPYPHPHRNTYYFWDAKPRFTNETLIDKIGTFPKSSWSDQVFATMLPQLKLAMDEKLYPIILCGCNYIMLS